MDSERAIMLFTLCSPVSFIILALPKARLRLTLFLLLAATPPAFILYVVIAKLDAYAAAGDLTISIFLSVVFTLLGFAFMVKEEPKTKAFFISILGTVIASSPLSLMLISSIVGVIRDRFFKF
jgi:hypothetical protein